MSHPEEFKQLREALLDAFRAYALDRKLVAGYGKLVVGYDFSPARVVDISPNTHDSWRFAVTAATGEVECSCAQCRPADGRVGVHPETLPRLVRAVYRCAAERGNLLAARACAVHGWTATDPSPEAWTPRSPRYRSR